MPKSDNQKQKILFILDYLRKNSGPDRPVPTGELIEMLARQGITCDRKTVYSDIAALQDYGEDIISLSGRSGGFYLASRSFELPELKLLINAVTSSRYLSERKSRELIEKLCQLCSEEEGKQLKRNIYVSNRVKSMNESIYYSVDTIQEAISANRQIRFRYFDYGIRGNRIYRQKEYLASPYGLCQDNENCYLLALSPRHGITSYRIDRMTEITLLEDERVPCPELTGKSLNEYAGKMFQMYSGEPVSVKLRFHKSLANVVIDRFGRSTLLIPDGDEHFVFTAEVAVSPLFLSWVIGFGDKAQILHPKTVIDECIALSQKATNQYQTSEKD